jgi:hypothetical protein
MKATIIKPVKVALKKKLIEPLKEIPPMAHWHPAKVAALVGIITLVVGLGSSIGGFQVQYGGLVQMVKAHEHRLDLYKTESQDFKAATEKRFDCIETTLAKLSSRSDDIWTLLVKDMQPRQVKAAQVSEDNSKKLDKLNGKAVPPAQERQPKGLY